MRTLREAGGQPGEAAPRLLAECRYGLSPDETILAK